MFNPRMQISANRFIQAARPAVWKKFTRLAEWPRWQPQVDATGWESGEGWQEGHRFRYTHSGHVSHALIRMVSPGAVTVWEVESPAGSAVYTLHCTDQLGGCKVVLRCTYHGVAVLWLWLQRGQRQQELQAILTALKTDFDQR